MPGGGERSIAEVIRSLLLVPHPEGGHYREVHRSALGLGTPPGYPAERVASTAIYFLLGEGEFSAFHRIRGEEIWVHLDGSDLELVLLGGKPERLVLSHDPGKGPLISTVPAGTLQAARSLGRWTLCCCLVAPGFEFADFEMPARSDLLAAHPEHREIIDRFTR